VYGVALPEQQAFGVLVSVSGPMHVQIPLHMPEMQASLPEQAAPLGSWAWQAPPSQ
jgi:hypothetical protein